MSTCDLRPSTVEARLRRAEAKLESKVSRQLKERDASWDGIAWDIQNTCEIHSKGELSLQGVCGMHH